MDYQQYNVGMAQAPNKPSIYRHNYLKVFLKKTFDSFSGNH